MIKSTAQLEEKNMSLEIKNARIEDFEDVFKLLEQLWRDTKLDKENLAKVYSCILDRNETFNKVVFLDDKIIAFFSGFISMNLFHSGKVFYLQILIVDENHRKQGIGKKIIDDIAAISSQENCKAIELDSAFFRKSAHRFYTNLGFSKRGYVFSKSL